MKVLSLATKFFLFVHHNCKSASCHFNTFRIFLLVHKNPLNSKLFWGQFCQDTRAEAELPNLRQYIDHLPVKSISCSVS